MGLIANRQPGCDAVGDGFLAAMQFSRPSGNTQRHAAVCYSVRAGSVLSLFFHGSPTAIGRRVVAIIIDSLKRMSRRGALSHVGQETRERFSPCQADPDAATAISCVIRPIRVLAARDHVFPDAIFGQVAQAVRPRGFAARVVIETTTALRVSGSESARGNFIRTTAIASAAPIRLGVSLVSFVDYDQSTESLAGQIVALHGEQNTAMSICAHG